MKKSVIVCMVAVVLISVFVGCSVKNSDVNENISKCKENEYFNTDVSCGYGDKLITLSTCEYSQENGRLIVVAKKVK